MIASISYGTYLIFGCLTSIGAAFIWFYVPETKRLTLEEMDVVFGSPGTAQADLERMEEVNAEIGLNSMLHRENQNRTSFEEKNGGVELEEKSHVA
jgi:hypothetical protein